MWLFQTLEACPEYVDLHRLVFLRLLEFENSRASGLREVMNIADQQDLTTQD